MARIIRPKQDIMLTAAPDIEAIIQPLKQLGINFFSHTRVFDDGTRIDLNNRADMAEYFYYQSQCYVQYTPEVTPRAYNDNYIYMSNLGDNAAVKVLRDVFDIDHMLINIVKHQHYCDIWNYGTKKENDAIENVYPNLLPMLTKFTYFFQDKAQKLIKAHEQDRIKILDEEGITPQPTEDSCHCQRVAAQIRPKRYFLGDKYDNQYLTRREVEIINCIAAGLTASEVGKKLHITKSTVETHIDNMKAKLNCHNKTRLIGIAAINGLLDASIIN